MIKNENILIIGQGLAGTILSFQFLKKNIPHKLVDNNHLNSATKAAAGLINPITGRRYVKSWMIEDLLVSAKQQYNELEDLLGISLITKHTVIRAINNISQENQWESSTSRPNYSEFTADENDCGGYQNFVNESWTYRKIKKAMIVDVSALIQSYADFLMTKNMLIKDQIDFDQTDFTSVPFKYNNEIFSKVIFCEGYKAIENPFFNYLPFQPSKGEALKIKIDNLKTEDILRDDIFIVPQKSDEFWSGGEYVWEFENDKPSERFHKSWLNKLRALIKGRFSVVGHVAGVRPSVKGRRPLIGQHTKWKHLYIFNGMGTKGTSLIPYFAEEFSEYLFGGGKINPEVDIIRFNK